jgi:hypothetical protein
MHGDGYVDSDDGRHRYRQWSVWDHDMAPVMFVLLHAPAPWGRGFSREEVMATCADLARSWGSGGVVLVSLYSVVTDHYGIIMAPEARSIGRDADDNIRLAASVVDVVVPAWGSAPFARERAEHVMKIIGDGAEVSCLGYTAIGGYPTDPLHPRVKATGGRRFPFAMVQLGAATTAEALRKRGLMYVWARSRYNVTIAVTDDGRREIALHDSCQQEGKE